MQSWLNNSYILSLLLACWWGPSFMFIKVGLTSFPPLILVELRLAIAAVLLLIYIKCIGVSLPKSGKTWLHCAVQGVLAAALPFSLYALGEQYVDSILAAIINGLTPIFTVLAAPFFLKSEKLTLDRFFGVVLGFVGFCFLLIPALLHQKGGIEADVLGIITIFLAALSYGIAIIYGKMFLSGHISIAIPSCQILCGAVFLLPFSILFDLNDVHLSSIELPAVLSVLGLAFFGTVLGFITYFKILEVAGAVILAMAIYLLPVFGIFFGVLVLDEKLSPALIFGVIFIILGMMFANKTISLKFRLKLRKVED